MPRESALAYHGIWRDYSLPRHHELVWTWTTPQLLCVLALLAALLAFAQQRWWVITRYILIKILHPIRLADSDKTSIDNLTQGRALKALLFKQNTTVVSISPWFGTVSLFNFLLFLAIGATLPHFLTGGGPGPARVVSQATSDCRGFLEFSPNVV
ncbi:hypothetical protein BJX66DRAFT_342594 [Aspergillus keveii]|uniref:Uncharacterized protein n=1 Tax=Aspergillus keveii TaxID=714993 RepID=A0ABR4FRU1_9EURO